jgi:hypothetical protein
MQDSCCLAALAGNACVLTTTVRGSLTLRGWLFESGGGYLKEEDVNMPFGAYLEFMFCLFVLVY